MKTITLIMMLVMSTVVTSQIVPYVKGGVDLKMLKEGPHSDNDEYANSSWDIEIQGGIEFNINKFPVRLGIGFQTHKEIEYRKVSFMIDYRLMDFPLKNIHCYAGVEVSSIFREFPDAKPTDKYWRNHEVTKYIPGVNAEIQWMFLPNMGAGAQINAFGSEEALKRYGKDYRWEWMLFIVIKTDELFR